MKTKNKTFENKKMIEHRGITLSRNAAVRDTHDCKEHLILMAKRHRTMFPKSERSLAARPMITQLV